MLEAFGLGRLQLWTLSRSTSHHPRVQQQLAGGTASRARAQASMASEAAPGIPSGAAEHPGWDYFRNVLGSAAYHVAPMVDQSELAFRELCRRYGATCAYTPMLHARLFVESEAYRAEHFTTCASDRPLLVQFCANDPELLLAAARLAAPHCDGIDLNLGCPQRIAKRGNYGAFLMDDLPTVQRLVETLYAAKLCVPVTCKIRLFPDVAKTVAYAQMLEKAGCMLLAVHGRTRDQKDTEKWRADWAAIRAVRESVSLPVLANGDVRDLNEARACMEATGCCGVLSAEPLLHNPALFDPAAPSDAAAAAAYRPAEWPALLALEYCQLARQHGTPMRMVRGHMHKLLGGWLGEFTDQRDLLNNTRHGDAGLTIDGVEAICTAVAQRIREACAVHRRGPVAKKGERAIAREAAEAQALAVARAVEEQRREEGAVRALEAAQECHVHAEPQDGGRKRTREEEDAAPRETTH